MDPWRREFLKGEFRAVGCWVGADRGSERLFLFLCVIAARGLHCFVVHWTLAILTTLTPLLSQGG